MQFPDKSSFIVAGVEVSIYPNPTTDGHFSLKLTGLEKSEKVNIKVYNLIGSEVYSHSFSSFAGENKREISLTTVPKGIYMVEVSLGEEKYTHRLSLL